MEHNANNFICKWTSNKVTLTWKEYFVMLISNVMTLVITIFITIITHKIIWAIFDTSYLTFILIVFIWSCYFLLVIWCIKPKQYKHIFKTVSIISDLPPNIETKINMKKFKYINPICAIVSYSWKIVNGPFWIRISCNHVIM